jgi:NAD(P)-dependent dehydrogenase (short-subunit alcohol dehydrogenase family)
MPRNKAARKENYGLKWRVFVRIRTTKTPSIKLCAPSLCSHFESTARMVLYSEVDKPSLDGKVIIITGSSSGIGLEAARIFVKECGAHVILACRNLKKAKPFEDELNAAGPGKATLLRIDTSDLASVRCFVTEFTALGLNRVDFLLLNAGTMFGEWRTVKTVSSETPNVEFQMATNHLGHFLLTALLLPTIISTPGSRIVSVSSVAAKLQKAIDYDVVCARMPSKYNQFAAYAYTKLANLLFTRELSRRLKVANASTIAVACHPGYARTNLTETMDQLLIGKIESLLVRRFVSHDSVSGSHPLVLACTDPEPNVETGVYYAPSGFMEMKGPASSTAGAVPTYVTDEAASELWTISERLCGEHML